MATETNNQRNAAAPNTFSGFGHVGVAYSLYETAALREVARMRTEGVYVCIGNALARLPEYDGVMMTNVLWQLALSGRL